MKRILGWFAGFFLFGAVALATAQQAAPPASTPPPAKPATAEFYRAADEVLEEVSRLLSLPVKAPLKKSIRNRQEIRDYVLRHFQEEREPAKRYADQKALEKFGLIPRGFALEAFLVELLTEQIAGLYDPKGKEFFIADWIGLDEQRMVMAHELTHALHDQHFNLDAWLRAARPNDDALMARGALLEGAAVGAMIDYLLRGPAGGGVSVRDLPGIEQFVGQHLLGDLEKNPQLAKAPPYIRDALLFPYLAGTSFTQRVLRARSGWADFHKVFGNPPVSTQQILHPDLYLAGIAPRRVSLPDFSPLLPPGWRLLDENIAGEFGMHGILKQFLGEERAARLSPAWAGDRYAIFEHEKTKEVILVFRLRLESVEDAARLFGNLSEALELKYPRRKELFRRPNFFSFSTDERGVFLKCVADECLTVEGTDRAAYDKITRAIGWPPAPRPPARKPQRSVVTVMAAVSCGTGIPACP